VSAQLTRQAPLGSRALLSRILDQPNLVAAVQALPAQALGKLIDHVGLEDSGEIVALATTEQLRRIFDDDLWRSECPGKDEEFHAERFALWLEIMLEAGEEFAAQRLAELPEDLVTLALQKHLLVINIDELALAMSGRQSREDALLEKALESCLGEEIGEFRIISRRHDGWDAILSVLLALDRNHHDFLQRVLERCCWVAAEFIEENGGLFDVLNSEDMLETDVAADREDRRAEEGFIAPSSAASFLLLARDTEVADIVRATERDPVTRAYFRGLRKDSGAQVGTKHGNAAPNQESTRAAAKLVEVLRDAELLEPARLPLLLEGKANSEQDTDAFTRALRDLQERGGDMHRQRMEELAFLANVLVAGCSIEGRAFRPVEAARAVVALCNLGLEWMIENKRGPSEPTAALQMHGADKLFRLAWRLLDSEVARPATKALELLRARQGVIEPAILETLKGLSEKCPFLCAKLREGAQSRKGGQPGEIRFIATTDELRSAKAFLASLGRD
jgi:hypothetical protein